MMMIKDRVALRHLPATVTLAAMCLSMVSAHAGQPRPKHATAIDVTSRLVPLNAEMPSQRQLGALTYLGGIEMVSTAPEFGGLSGLAVARDQSHFLSLTDTGQWVCASLEIAKDGTMTAVSDVWMAAMQDPPGFIAKRRKDRDAEALAITPDGAAAYTAFEGDHRIWRYAIDDPTDLCSAASAKPARVPLPPEVAVLPSNGGMESVTLLGDGTAIILGEAPLRTTKAHPGWIGSLDDGTAMRPFTYTSKEPFSPTDIAAVDDGVFILHRHFSVLSGVSGMIGWAPSSDIAPAKTPMESTVLGQLGPPISVDNFEGVSALPDGKGGYIVYIVSDDNFSPFQRTLLLKFHLSSQSLESLQKAD